VVSVHGIGSLAGPSTASNPPVETRSQRTDRRGTREDRIARRDERRDDEQTDEETATDTSRGPPWPVVAAVCWISHRI
jgi:hypothetical protein